MRRSLPRPSQLIQRRSRRSRCMHWREPSFDIWEEESGQHYYTLCVSAAALSRRRATGWRRGARTRRPQACRTRGREPFCARSMASGCRSRATIARACSPPARRSTKELDIARHPRRRFTPDGGAGPHTYWTRDARDARSVSRPCSKRLIPSITPPAGARPGHGPLRGRRVFLGRRLVLLDARRGGVVLPRGRGRERCPIWVTKRRCLPRNRARVHAAGRRIVGTIRSAHGCADIGAGTWRGAMPRSSRASAARRAPEPVGVR